MHCNIHVNVDICISTLLPSSVCCNQMCPVTTVTKDVPRLRLYPGHSESGHTIGWLIAFFGLKKPFHHYLSLSLTSFLSPPTPSYSLCTYLHLDVSQVNKSHSVVFFPRPQGEKCCCLAPQRGVEVFCWLASCLLFISTLSFCLVAKEVNCSPIIL